MGNNSIKEINDEAQKALEKKKKEEGKKKEEIREEEERGKEGRQE